LTAAASAASYGESISVGKAALIAVGLQNFDNNLSALDIVLKSLDCGGRLNPL